MDGHHAHGHHALGRHRRRANAFTLTELLVVLGMIGMLISLLLPVVNKAWAASNSAACLSNLRQMGTAWTMYSADNQGRFPDYVWRTPATPNVAWNGYWPGVLDDGEVRGESLLCPGATKPSDRPRGYGTARLAWSGKASPNASTVRFDANRFRVSSYGYNRYLTAGGGFLANGKGSRVQVVKAPAEVPLFADAAFVDFRPVNGSPASPVALPPNLLGDRITAATPDHWLFLFARHGRGVNVVMVDGSARQVRAEDMYTLTWKANWVKYPLRLP
jgi:prepilin-type processing-associated H-X9-DG protein